MPSLGITEWPKKTRHFFPPPFDERFSQWAEKIRTKEADVIDRVGYLLCQLRRKYADQFGLTNSFVVFLPGGMIVSLETGRQL